MKYASVLQRIAAWIIDLFILVAIIIVLVGVGIMSTLFTGGFGPFSFMMIGSVFLVMFFYTILLEAYWNGQTVGKKVLGIKVVKENGKKINLKEAFLRNVFRVIDNQFAGVVGLVLIIVTKKKQRIGDIIAKTVVVKE